MWEMNGTQVLVNQFIGQVPTNWHVSGTADVNGDGRSDVIWTSDAGDHRVWEMNGTQVIADLAIGPNGTPASPPLNGFSAASTAATAAATVSTDQSAHVGPGGFFGDVSVNVPVTPNGGPGGDPGALSSLTSLLHDQHFIV